MQMSSIWISKFFHPKQIQYQNENFNEDKLENKKIFLKKI